MTKKMKEKAIARCLKTKEGYDKLGIAIAKGMFNVASTPGPVQNLVKAYIDVIRTDKTVPLDIILENFRKSKIK